MRRSTRSALWLTSATGRIHAGTLRAPPVPAPGLAARSTGCCGWPRSRLSRWSRSRWSSAAAAAARDHARHRGQGSAPPRYRRIPRAPRRTRLRAVNRRAPGRFRWPPATTAPRRSASCRSDKQGELEHRVQDVGEHQGEQPESGSASSPRSGRWPRSRPPPVSSSPWACTRHGLPARPDSYLRPGADKTRSIRPQRGQPTNPRHSVPLPGCSVEGYREQHLHGGPGRRDVGPPRLVNSLRSACIRHRVHGPAPANLLARLEGVSEQPCSSGAARFGRLYHAEVARQGEERLAVSRTKTELECREELCAHHWRYC